MPHRTRPMTALLLFTGLNVVLYSGAQGVDENFKPVQGSVAGLSHVSTSVSNHDVKFWEYQTIQKPMKTDGARMKIRKVTHGPSIQAWRRGSKPLEQPAKNGKKRC